MIVDTLTMLAGMLTLAVAVFFVVQYQSKDSHQKH
jgi:hypothetical protein